MAENGIEPAGEVVVVEEKVFAARLDDRGVYQGVDELDSAEALTDRHLPEVTECDLPPGKYRWNRERKTFEALEHASVRAAVDVPSVEEIVYELAGHLGEKASPAVIKWMDWYRSSIDGRTR